MEYAKNELKPMSDEELDEVAGGRRAGASFSKPGQAASGKGARGKGARGQAVGGRGKGARGQAVGARGKGARGQADR